jgi:hypothetical protein
MFVFGIPRGFAAETAFFCSRLTVSFSAMHKAITELFSSSPPQTRFFHVLRTSDGFVCDGYIAEQGTKLFDITMFLHARMIPFAEPQPYAEFKKELDKHADSELIVVNCPLVVDLTSPAALYHVVWTVQTEQRRVALLIRLVNDGLVGDYYTDRLGLDMLSASELEISNRR